MTTRLPIRSFRLTLVVLGLAACREDPARIPIGCDVAGACAVEGADLAIVDVDVGFSAEQRFRSEVDAHVVLPGATLPVRIEVFNRGTVASTAALLAVGPGLMIDTVEVPVLEAGESFRTTVGLIVSELPYSFDMLNAVTVSLATDSTPGYEDAEAANDRATGPEFHIRVPVLETSIRLPDTVRALHPYAIAVHFTNRSPFEALREEPSIGFCFFDDGYYCDEPGEITTLPPVMAGETRIVPVSLVVPHESIELDWVDDGGVGLCFVLPGLLPEQLVQGCRAGSPVYVLPNIEAACQPRVLTPPASFDPGQGNAHCQDPYGFLDAVVALDAEEGDRFELRAPTGMQYYLEIVDFDVNTYDVEYGVFTAPRTGRYYLLTHVYQGAGLIQVVPLP